ncbi:LysR family transcriptional regulator [Acidovorax sp. CCYZU-2555]|uniref:LysR family transcriptional regulator n=1 Tax=Acidovorax sp. CCYZU-2555 TaxID=2835042 RepID=UPI001BD1B2D1|nr:LysR family transcriptional regulator [Acidovorax sp. CCYZU-2555]MBS7777201.1 LysR family transcriptional regulator [Acidovorax sp. CCYZU-2555]
MDKLQCMKVFVKVVELGGFAGAARALRMSPPAVTRAIAMLEEGIGARLLQRTTRSVKPTEAGARYLEDCRRILLEVDEADAGAAGAHGTPSGTLTVTASTRFGTMHVLPILTEYLDRHPAMTGQALFVDRNTNLVEEGIDVAVRIGHLPSSGYHAIKVGSVRRVVCASPSYLTAAGRPEHPSDLGQHNIIASVGTWSSLEWRFGQDHQISLQVRPRLFCNTNEAAIDAALQGWGISRVLSYQVAADIHSGRLEVVLAQFEEPALPVHVVHAEGRRVTAKSRAFIDLAVERLRSNPALVHAD